MSERCLLYYVTDRTTFGADELTRRKRLLEKISEAAQAGVHYIQLREKDLSARELQSLAREAAQIIQAAGKTALLINSRADVALAVGADGVHLRSKDISPREVKRIWSRGAGTHARRLSLRSPLISVSCHSPAEVNEAAVEGATFAVFAPLFEKKDTPDARPAGLAMLRESCRAKIPVIALGGVTLANAHSCLDAGAAGIAAIRLFQENDIEEIARNLNGSQI